MKHFLTLAAVGLALSIPGSAYADSITSTITAYSATAGELTGTVTVDTTLGQVTGVDLTVDQGGVLYVFDTIHYQFQEQYGFGFDSNDEDGTGPALLLIEFAGSANDFTIKTPICTAAAPCNTTFNSFFALGPGQGVLFDSGTPSVTPEPSSLALLGTGVLGLAGMARRRFVRS